MVCFLRLLSRTITPNRTTHSSVLRFQLCTPSCILFSRRRA